MWHVTQVPSLCDFNRWSFSWLRCVKQSEQCLHGAQVWITQFCLLLLLLFYLQTHHTCLYRSSPGGATTEWTVTAPADEAYYSLIDPMRMKDWVGLVGWPTEDVWPTKWSSVQLAVRRRTGKVRRSRPAFYHCAMLPTLAFYVSKQVSDCTELCAVKLAALKWHVL